MDDQTTAALRLLAELQNAHEVDTHAIPGQAPAVRVILRTPDGEYLGETLLSTRATNEAANVVSCAAAYPLTKPAAPTPELDPLLVADLEDMFADIDPASYLADVFAGPDAEASIAAFEEITGEWDGQL
ncbi:hypothetical protein [[Kitasatospora] papulosa]|uniref:hypothetical protein n=1 Tax=[Kitasatospora] papulosa TaxID=1464011 RepID=UPI003634624E